jgi:hypothetical protein
MGKKLTAKALLAVSAVLFFGVVIYPLKTKADEKSLPGKVQTKTIITDFLNIDRIYPSMVGPMDMASLN